MNAGEWWFMSNVPDTYNGYGTPEQDSWEDRIYHLREYMGKMPPDKFNRWNADCYYLDSGRRENVDPSAEWIYNNGKLISEEEAMGLINEGG